MNVLAFDTCFGACSVAVVRNLGTHCTRLDVLFERRDTGHAEILVPYVASTLRKAGLRLADIDLLAVTVGPGTFTGTRIGVAAARAFALATGLPVATTTSLAVMAEEAAEEIEDRGAADLLVAMDARRDAVYAQLFGADGMDAKSPPLVLPVGEAARLIEGSSVVVGSAAEGVAEAARRLGHDARSRFPNLVPDAVTLAFLAPRLVPQCGGEVHPLYLREADAKPQNAVLGAKSHTPP